MTKKVVLKIGLHGEKDRKHVLKAVAKVEGINEVVVDMEKGTLTVIGNVDAVCIVNRLRKCCYTVEIDSVGPPPKPPEKKPEQPKPETKKEPSPPPPCHLPPPLPPPCYHPCPPPCPPYPSPCYSTYDYDRNTCSFM